MAQTIAGGYMEAREASKEIQQICDKVKCDVERKTNKMYGVFKAVQYRSQVVAGVNYLIKVHVGGHSYLHLKVWKKLPSYGGEVVLFNVEQNRQKEDPIIPF
ncbi:cystatin-A [Archocentrus centrarchus]|uniref:cystatin-A n=1 Tax=Archocentrus centrarchus TaxID=63155 RepID=UPI0011EA051A|nr:cystatin-A [Archocentrus centrarchus]